MSVSIPVIADEAHDPTRATGQARKTIINHGEMQTAAIWWSSSLVLRSQYALIKWQSYGLIYKRKIGSILLI